MSRVIAVMACGFMLSACSATMPSLDFLKSTPQPETLAIESEPPGAEAKTSLGESCRTPCKLSAQPGSEFSVTLALSGYQPQTVSVRREADGAAAAPRLAPNPVHVALRPVAPAKKLVAKKRDPSRPPPVRRYRPPWPRQRLRPRRRPHLHLHLHLRLRLRLPPRLRPRRRQHHRRPTIPGRRGNLGPIAASSSSRWTLWPISARIPTWNGGNTAFLSLPGNTLFGRGVPGGEQCQARDDARRAKSRPRSQRSASRASRPVRARDHLSARLGDRPLRFSLRLLHVGAHDLPAQGRPALARRARPAVQRLHRARGEKAAAHRRRTAGAPRGHDARRLARAPSLDRRARRAHADYQWLAAGEICR